MSIRVFFLFAVLALPFFAAAQDIITLGAYYFDGWGSTNSHHLTPKLRDSFPERKPKWGWVTSTPQAMKEQIDLAADAGLAFFSFDWYYPDYDKKNFRQDALNHALNLYLRTPNKQRLAFCLMVANHAGQEIGPDDWPAVTDEWVKLMKDPQYLHVDGKPYLAFFDLRSLERLFGSKEALHKALDELRSKAGQPGATLAVCVSPNIRSVQEAKDCGFDVVTGYNYPDPAYKDLKKVHNVDSLAHFGNWVWNQFINAPLRYIPVATLNWDPRPWANSTNFYGKSVRYEGYDSSSVYRNIKAVRDWILSNPSSTSPEHVAMVYAWNEYGEGAWLTPSENDQLHLLAGVKKALSDSRTPKKYRNEN